MRRLRGFFSSGIGAFCCCGSTGRRLTSFVASSVNRVGVIFIPLNVFVVLVDNLYQRLNGHFCTVFTLDCH
ncbi:hypothetical protein ACQQ2M_35820, partial [Escherichia coli]